MSVICAQSGEEQRKIIHGNVNDRYDIAEVFLLSYDAQYGLQLRDFILKTVLITIKPISSSVMQENL